MYRQPSYTPPIPTFVEAEINADSGDGGFDDRSFDDLSRMSRGASQYRGFQDQHTRPTIPRQLQHPDSSIMPSPRDPYLQAQMIPTPRVQGTHASRRTPSLVRTKSSFLLEEQRVDLEEMGYPKGLATELGKNRSLFSARFWVLDNSGSMLNNDGHTIRGTAIVPCTRWAELEETIAYHAELAAVLQATSHFRMLNDPGVRVGPQEFSIADQGRTAREEIEIARNIMHNIKPNGSTPLTGHLLEIADRISEMEPMMRDKGLDAVVIIATDGLPTSPEGETSDAINNEFINALSRLQSLPVWIVIRLCTDEQAVVDFYNALDSVLELPLEVLDDHTNEAKEIHQFNSWLNYALPLHRCREIGYQHRIFDLLDERPLNKDEVKEFCVVLLGEQYFGNCPDVHNEWNDFLKFLSHLLKKEKPHFNPLTRKLEPWIDVAQLKKSFGGGLLGKMFKRKSSIKK